MSQDFVQRHKDFVESMKKRKPDLPKLPQRKPMYTKENIIALSNVPRKVINALVQMDITEVHVYGYDVAYPKELAERMDAIYEEYLYQGMKPEEKAKLDRDKEVLRAGNKLTLDRYNEAQKEALQRLAEKTIKEQVLNQDKEKVLKERSVEKMEKER